MPVILTGAKRSGRILYTNTTNTVTARSFTSVQDDSVGLSHLEELQPCHINCRVNGADIKNYDELYPRVTALCLLADETRPENWRNDWNQATAKSW